jgi:imidazolonepropionase
MLVDLIIHSAKELITMQCDGKPKMGKQMQDIGLISDGAIAVLDGLIVEHGITSTIREKYQAHEYIDASGKIVTPGFVDPHSRG